MAISNPASVIKGVMHFAYKAKGWSESHWLLDTTRAAAAETLRKIAWARTIWFAPGVTLVYARVSEEFVSPPAPLPGLNSRDGVACDLPYPMPRHPALPTLDTPNDPHVGARFRLECDSGAWGNRMLRGVSDDVIQNFALAVANPNSIRPFDIGDALINTLNPQTSTSVLNLSRVYLSYLRDRTQRVRKNPNPVVLTFQAEPWNRILCRGVGSHKTGGPFGQSRGRAPRRS